MLSVEIVPQLFRGIWRTFCTYMLPMMAKRSALVNNAKTFRRTHSSIQSPAKSSNTPYFVLQNSRFPYNRPDAKDSPNGTAYPSSSKRRSSLEGGLPSWAPCAAASSSKPSRRPSLAGGAPPWAPNQAKFSSEARSATSPAAGDDASRRRPSLGGGLPPWAPANNSVTGGGDYCADKSRRRRSSLEGGMPAWAPPQNTSRADEARGALKSVSPKEDGKAEAVAASAVLPDWLAAAAGEGSSGKVS